MLLSTCIASLTLAQPSELYFENFTERQGLSSNTIRSILKDSRGYIWLATFEGLNRFDGYEFEVFTYYPEDSCSLSNNLVSALAEDQNGRIWVGTHEGLNCFDPRTGCFTRYLHKPDDTNSISHNRVTDVIEDSQGNIWVTTYNGLNKLDPKTGVFHIFRHDAEDFTSIAQDTSLSVLEGKNGNLWIGLDGEGLAYYDTKTDKFSNYFFGDSITEKTYLANRIHDLYEDEEGQLWLATYRGMHQFDLENQFHRYFLHNPDEPNSLPDNILHAIKPDSHGHGFWIATDQGGIAHYHPETDKFTHYNTQQNTANLNTHLFFDLLIDDNGIWLGSLGKGLYKADIGQEQFQLLSSKYFFPGDKVSRIPDIKFEGRQGELLLTFLQSEILAVDPINLEPIEVPYLDLVNQLTDTYEFNRITWGASGELWIGTVRNGVLRLKLSEKKNLHYKSVQEGGSLPHPYVSALFHDSQGRMWVGTSRGLNLFQPQTDDFQVFTVESDAQGQLHHGTVTHIFEDSGSRIWVGTQGGLHLYQEQRGEFEVFLADKNDSSSLSDNHINSIIEDNLGHLWIGTQQGLNMLKESGEGYQFLRFDRRDGLQSELVMSLVNGFDGKVWMATGNGIANINPETLEIQYVKLDRRLESYSFPGGVALQQSGKLVFSNANVFVIFHPDSVSVNSRQPSVFITDFKVFNESVSPNDDTSLAAAALYPQGNTISYAEKVVLPYKARFLSFEFTAIDFENPENIEYAYQLEGFDDDWVYTGKNRFASFTNLSPGDYQLRVKAANADGVWGDAATSLLLRVTPPFWQTWWFILLMILAISLLLYLLHRYRLERALEVERLRVRIARDLHDDIGATLTKISLYADLMNQGARPTENNQMLHKIASMGRDTLKSFSDIVWAIDARNDTLGNLINKVQDIALSLLSPKNIDVAFQTEGIKPDTPIGAEKRQHLYLICKEAIHNIVKHAQATEVEISFIKHKDAYEIVIKDNGKGLTEIPLNGQGNGLRNMKQRATSLGGSLEIINENGLSLMIQGLKLT
ncbi:MAG: two-component regulator propeller domain-containing protein [Bacteroidota bacterium]